MKQLPAGVPAPDFTLQTLDARLFRLSEAVIARPVVLAFYKASCPTCQLTFPYLQRIHSQLGESAAYRILGISQDEPAETMSFAQRFGIQFEILIDEHPYPVSSLYGLEFVPTVFIVGRDRQIQLSDYGFSKTTISEIGKPLQLFPADDGLPATRPG